MKVVEIKDKIYWVGAIDWNIRDFHGYSTWKGTTYNSYLAVDEKIALFDTVKKPFSHQLIEHIRQVTDPRAIDYLIVKCGDGPFQPCRDRRTVKLQKIYLQMGLTPLIAFLPKGWPLEVVSMATPLVLAAAACSFWKPGCCWPDSMFSISRGTVTDLKRRLWPAPGLGRAVRR
jgi:hypothetical protein